MQTLLIIFLSILLVISMIKNLNSINKRKTNEPETHAYPESDINIDDISQEFGTSSTDEGEYKGKYQRRYLLTKNEWHEFRKLKYYANQQNLQVCPKVRLLDLIEPRKGIQHYKSYFYKIQAKHVDFLICDQNLYVIAIIELDDNSHNQIARKERDNFVDTILQDVGYRVIRTRSITESTLSILNTQNVSN